MTQKTIYKRAKRKFDMGKLATSIRKRLKKKNKTKVTKYKIREVWKDIVEIMIVEPLLRGEKVNVDGHLTFEIVAERITDKPNAMRLALNGNVLGRKGVKRIEETYNPLRRGLVYTIRMTDDRHKTKIYFEANSNIRTRLTKILKETAQQYRKDEPESISKY